MDFKGLSYFACPFEQNNCGKHDVQLSEAGEQIGEGEGLKRVRGSVCHYTLSFPEQSNNDQMLLNVKKLAKGFKLYMGIKNLENNETDLIKFAMETKENATLRVQAPY